MVVAVVGAAVAQTEAQTMIGLTLKIRTMMRMMQIKKTENINVKTMMNNIARLIFFFYLTLTSCI